MTTNIRDTSTFWSPYQGTITSVRDFIDCIDRLHDRHGQCRFVWRGSMDHRWAMNSSLFRRTWWAKEKLNPDSSPPNEGELAAQEAKVLDESRKWGLHSGARGMVSALEHLATLQHYGIPTRLIDVTFNPLIALFFAVEGGDCDGRLFAVDVSNRLASENDEIRRDLDTPLDIPWARPEFRQRIGWTRSTFVWRPAGFDRRIAAQAGAFLIGGVPSITNAFQAWNLTTGGQRLTTDQLRACVSVPIRLNKVSDHGSGRRSDFSFYTYQIPIQFKESIRRDLLQKHGIEHSVVYPDAPGMQSFGTTWLPRSL